MKSSKNKILAVTILLVLVFIISWNYYFDKEHLVSNTINGYKIGRISLSLGALIATLIFYKLINSEFLNDKHFSTIIIIGILLIPTMLIGKFGYHLNQILG
ncbi:MAG: hypothetical protein AAGK97_07995, partial [Bacteroidota bacterium]